MSAEHPVQHTPMVDPAAIEPTTTASEAKSDPIRPTGTDALTAESRPEIAAPIETTETVPSTGLATTEPKDGQVGTDSVIVEAQPVAEGILGYKAPGLVKSFRFSKKYFWFDDAAVDPQVLSTYLRSEKPEIGHHNAAYASQTGKGLLFFTKRVEDKSQPAGIINLHEASDVTKEGLTEFSFRLHGHKHTFQATTSAERDSWLVAVETKAAEAKSSHEGVIGSEGYKSHMDKLGKPAALATTAAAGAAATKSTLTSSNDGKVHDGTRDGDATAVGTSSTEVTAKHVDKSRSQSRKRGSIFGALLGKKEEFDDKKEVKAEEKAERTEIKKEEKELKREEKAEAKAEKAELTEEKDHIKPFDPVAIAARVLGEPVVPIEGSKAVAAEDTTSSTPVEATTARDLAPKPNKRNSVFGSFFNKRDNASPTRERKDKDALIAPVKDNEPAPLSATAPQLDDPVKTSPIQADEKVETKGDVAPLATDTPSAPDNSVPAPATTETPSKDIPTSPIATTPDTSKDKRRQSFFGTLGGKKERRTDVTSDSEVTDGEGKKSASGKLGGLFRKASRSTKSTGSGKPASTDVPITPTGKPGPTASEPMTSGGSVVEPKTNGLAVTKEENAISDRPEAVTSGHTQPAAVQASA